MQCDCCKQNNLNEILILRKHRFTKRGYMYREYHRVCFNCAVRLIRRGHYDLGIYWHNILFSIARSK